MNVFIQHGGERRTSLHQYADGSDEGEDDEEPKEGQPEQPVSDVTESARAHSNYPASRYRYSSLNRLAIQIWLSKFAVPLNLRVFLVYFV